MAGRGVRSKKFLAGLVLVLVLGGAGIAWMERAALLSWFYIRNLATADEVERDRWVECVVSLGDAAIPRLLHCWTRPDAQACANARAALDRLTASWGPSDARTLELALQLAREFPQFSRPGQKQALQLAAAWFASPIDPTLSLSGLASTCSRLLAEAAHVADAELQVIALELCGVLLNQPHSEDTLSSGRALTQVSLQATAPTIRLRAVRLALHPGMDLLERVVALLNDPEPDIRRAAVLAVGPAREAIHDECLLPSLHDPDPVVRRLCEEALAARGLRPEYLQLGRLLTDPHPSVRLKVLDHLRQSTDLDPGLWLRRLSHDPSPSVRAAALRAMTQQTFVDLSDRIDQMAHSDPSPTVCQLAEFYQKNQPQIHTDKHR